MTIEVPVTLDVHLQRASNKKRIWAYENEPGITLEDVLGNLGGTDEEMTLLIGPEGGWSEKEVLFLKKTNATPVSLGPWIYRAETAAIVAAGLCASTMRKSQQRK